MSSFLVVGGGGYVGSHVTLHLLAHGHEVTVFDNFSRGHRDALSGVPISEGDLLAPDDVRKAFQSSRFDAVMHFAALCYVGESMERPRDYYRNNVAGSINLFDAMLDAGVDKVVFSSTCATYGMPVAVPMKEDHPQSPINPYGASKLMVERILRDYAHAYGLNSTSLRYFNAAGCDPGGRIGERHDPETHLIPLALQEALRVRDGGDPVATSLVIHGTDYETMDGTCIRDYVHVDDLASAHLAAAHSMIEGQTGAHAFNLGAGRGHSVREVIDSCARVSGVPIQYRVGPRRPGDPAELVADARAAIRSLDWRPRYVDLDAIVGTAWRWFSATNARRASLTAS